MCLCGVDTDAGHHIYDDETDAACNVCGYQRFYQIIIGANGVYEQGSDKDYIIKVDADLALFGSVRVDGGILATDSYSATSGSTLITIKGMYLDTLTVGDHKIEVEYTDGKTAETRITIVASQIETAPSGMPGQQENENSEITATEIENDSETMASGVKSPATGDEQNIIVWAVLMLTLVVGGAGSLLYIKKKGKN